MNYFELISLNESFTAFPAYKIDQNAFSLPQRKRPI